MIFRVIADRARVPTNLRDTTLIVEDNWDDWGKYRTMFDVIVFDAQGTRHDIGSVKIGQRGLRPSGRVASGERAPSLPKGFDHLDEDFFSLGQSDTYYESLNVLPQETRVEVFRGLRDCAFDLTIFDSMFGEDVMGESLLRFVEAANVRNRFNRLAHGDAVLTPFDFEFQLPSRGSVGNPPTLTFLVEPLSEPPTNVHVLIGRNGVGKTRCIQSLAHAVLLEDPDPETAGILSAAALRRNEWAFAGLVAVTFSAFDRFRLPEVTRRGMRADLIGLPRQQGLPTDDAPQELQESLAEQFLGSFAKCRAGQKRERLQLAIETLENDPLFAEIGAIGLLDLPENEWEQAASGLFDQLSSGHGIVLLTITRLVELVDERTIVLMDEPEEHLHPPLLSAFIRALSDLLVRRNGVAIVATHSPVVLQEVPKSCVWVLRRGGRVSVAERPTAETFGENVGVLTREVFGLEVTNSGFHQLLRKAVAEPDCTFESVVAKFDGKLGAEARLIVRSLVAIRDMTEDE